MGSAFLVDKKCFGARYHHESTRIIDFFVGNSRKGTFLYDLKHAEGTQCGVKGAIETQNSP